MREGDLSPLEQRLTCLNGDYGSISVSNSESMDYPGISVSNLAVVGSYFFHPRYLIKAFAGTKICLNMSTQHRRKSMSEVYIFL